MGHIELASPGRHICYFKGRQSRIGRLVDLLPRNLERILYFALYVVTHIDEQARQQELMRIDEEVVKLDQNLDEKVVERINSLKEKRESDIQNALSRNTADQQEIEARREQELEAAKRAESETLAQLREAIGQEAVEGIVFAPTDRVIVKEGDVVAPKDIETLERVAEVCRNDIAEKARHEINALQAERDHIEDRLRVDYQGQIDSVQTQLNSQRIDMRQPLQQLRRHLASLNKMYLILINHYRLHPAPPPSTTLRSRTSH